MDAQPGDQPERLSTVGRRKLAPPVAPGSPRSRRYGRGPSDDEGWLEGDCSCSIVLPRGQRASAALRLQRSAPDAPGVILGNTTVPPTLEGGVSRHPLGANRMPRGRAVDRALLARSRLRRKRRWSPLTSITTCSHSHGLHRAKQRSTAGLRRRGLRSQCRAMGLAGRRRSIIASIPTVVRGASHMRAKKLIECRHDDRVTTSHGRDFTVASGDIEFNTALDRRG